MRTDNQFSQGWITMYSNHDLHTYVCIPIMHNKITVLPITPLTINTIVKCLFKSLKYISLSPTILEIYITPPLLPSHF